MHQCNVNILLYVIPASHGHLKGGLLGLAWSHSKPTARSLAHHFRYYPRHTTYLTRSEQMMRTRQPLCAQQAPGGLPARLGKHHSQLHRTMMQAVPDFCSLLSSDRRITSRITSNVLCEYWQLAASYAFLACFGCVSKVGMVACVFRSNFTQRSAGQRDHEKDCP